MMNSAIALGESPWTVTPRNKSLFEHHETCEGYRRLRMNLINRGVGDFTIELSGKHPTVEALRTQGSGLVVRPRGVLTPIMSGRIIDSYTTRSRDDPDGTFTGVGLTDEVILAKELCFPSTTTDIPTASTVTIAAEHDQRTGPAETVLLDYIRNNIGPAAGIARRRYPWLNVPASLGRGTSGTWKERFSTLLDLAQRASAFGGINFRVVQGAPGKLDVVITIPVDRPEAKFSVAAGNLTSMVLITRAPEVDELILGGQGELEARVFTRAVRAGSEAEWGHRSTRFRDQTHTAEYADMQQDATEIFAETAATAGIQIYPIELPTLRFGVHYNLGDKVYADEMFDVVQQVTFEHSPEKAPSVTPSIGHPDQEETAGLVNRVREMLRGPQYKR